MPSRTSTASPGSHTIRSRPRIPGRRRSSELYFFSSARARTARPRTLGSNAAHAMLAPLMIWNVPIELEQAVLAATRDVLGEAPLAAAALHRGVVDRSERYTSERERLARPADRSADLAARAAFFTIADAIKIQIPLAELRGRNALPAASPLRVVDVGAGCGALGLGLAAAGLAFRYHALDRDDQALAIAAKAMRAFAPACEVATTGCDVTKQALPAADLI